jgi:hypothetical protein
VLLDTTLVFRLVLKPASRPGLGRDVVDILVPRSKNCGAVLIQIK